jgi:anti-sigma regulatory factor (Ser/Thr protein kinase)
LILSKEKIIEIALKEGNITTRNISDRFAVSRQYANILISGLVADGKLIKIGSTRKASYVTPEYASKHMEVFLTKINKSFTNKNLEEHKIINEIGNKFPLLYKAKENVRSIFTYAFSEMLNNAIEHSGSEKIDVEVSMENKTLSFTVNDYGIGVFRNIMQKKGLRSETEAIQDLLKGKTTTMPKSHSGEGIFFTSKVGDLFTLDSYGHQLIVDNRIDDVFLQNPAKIKKGTKVVFKISTESENHLSEVFKRYTDFDNDGDYGFDKTEVKIKLYTMGGVHVSRSQARRVLSGLEKFKSIIFDFDKVPMIGQAFADEIFRVFGEKNPQIKINAINANEAVKFMIDRVGKSDHGIPSLFD